MEKTELYKLIENSHLLKELSKEKLDELIQRYPWFASAHLLKAKLSQLQDHSEAESILSSAAVYANNRVALFELIYPSAPERIFRIETENIESLSNGNGKADSTIVTETKTDKEILTVEELQEVELLISNSEKLSEQNSAEISEEINVVSIAESGLQITEFADEEIIQAGDHEEEGILAVENAVLKEQEENLSNEFDALNQSGSSAEFIPMEIDEEQDEPEIDKNEVELSSTRLMDEEIENSEVDEMLKDAEVEILSSSEYSHKNEEDETDEEGIAEEDFETELESLKNIEAQNAIEILDAPVLTAEKMSSTSTEEHSFLDWLRKFSPEKPPHPEKISHPGVEIIEEEQFAVSADQEANEESLIDFTPDLITINNYEDLRVIDNFVHSLKEKKTEPKQSNVIDRAEKSLENSDEIVTETLARILTAQNKYQSAISMYEKLSLKLPHKSHYFAALIKELKNKL